ncbi:hypothetical protein MNBD_PLANCTO02-3221 [hydrothermal vent metagenome]|uniref:Esterase n=1 Tax=hydrothermal vent metagenome TaxID=652676 RepID=A0A3B1DZJ4_9ZZZZ
MTNIAGTWSQIDLAGKKIDIYEPAQPAEHGDVVLHLHGHGLTTIAENPVYSAQLEKHGLRCLCPHGERSWWSDVICDEFDTEITPLDYLLQQVVPFIQEKWNCKPPHIGLMGISMGGQGVLQLSYRHARNFPVVAAISPAVDFQNWHGEDLPITQMFPNKEAARQATAILQIHPLNWPRHQLIVCDPTDAEWFDSSDKLTMKLGSSGIMHERDLETSVRKTSAGGHSWDYFNHMAEKVIGFVAERLEKVRSETS